MFCGLLNLARLAAPSVNPQPIPERVDTLVGVNLRIVHASNSDTYIIAPVTSLAIP
jgi:hypothetical protein